MTFNQWFACEGKKLDGTSRLAFEAVWDAMSSGGYSGNQIGSLLTDLVRSLPELELVDEDE